MYKNKITPVIVFILLLLGMAVFPYIPLIIFRIDIDNFSNGMKILYEFICDIGFMITIYTLYHKRINEDFKKYFKHFKKNFEISFKYYFMGYIFMFISNVLISSIVPNATAGNEDIVRNMINMYPLYMLFSVSIYAPFIEELIFRKSIKDAVLFKDNKIMKYIYIIISGLIFAGLHVLGVSNNMIDYLYIIPYLSLGITFALLYYKTDNIFSSIMMHSLHNTVAIILYLLGGV